MNYHPTFAPVDAPECLTLRQWMREPLHQRPPPETASAPACLKGIPFGETDRHLLFAPRHDFFSLDAGALKMRAGYLPPVPARRW